MATQRDYQRKSRLEVVESNEQMILRVLNLLKYDIDKLEKRVDLLDDGHEELFSRMTVRGWFRRLVEWIG